MLTRMLGQASRVTSVLLLYINDLVSAVRVDPPLRSGGRPRSSRPCEAALRAGQIATLNKRVYSSTHPNGDSFPS